MTMKYFYNDLKKAKPSENFCTALLKSMSEGKWDSVKNVADVVEFRKRGDIEVETKSGKKIYFDVKDESRFCDIPDTPIAGTKSIKQGKKGTGNILAEQWIERYEKGKERNEDGMMISAHYDYVIIFSWEGKQLLIVDFPKWQEVYDDPEFIFEFHGKLEYTKDHKNQKSITHGFLNPIDKLIEEGVVVAKIWFDYDGTKKNFSNVRVTKHETYSQWVKSQKKVA